MAGQRALPGLGLVGFWDEGSNGWKPDMDENLRRLSALVQLNVASRTVPLPSNLADGAVYIVPDNAGANAKRLALRDNGTWVYLSPIKGLRATVKDEDKFYWYNGTAWVEEQTGGIEEAPLDGKQYARKDAGWVEVQATGGGGTVIVGAIFSPIGDMTGGSGSAFALKGNVVTATDDLKIGAVSVPILATGAGETYEVRVYQLVGTTNEITTLLATSSGYVSTGAGQTTALLSFETPVGIETGTSYAVVVARTDGAANAECHVASNTGDPKPSWLGTTFVRSVWHDASLDPAPGSTLETLADAHVEVGLYLFLADLGTGVDFPVRFFSGTTDAPVAGDIGKLIIANNAVTATSTIPLDFGAVGDVLTWLANGAGTLNIAGATGVTVNKPDGFTLAAKGRYTTVSAIKTAANEWVLTGALAAA